MGAAAKLVPEGVAGSCRGGGDCEMVPVSYSAGEEEVKWYRMAVDNEL